MIPGAGVLAGAWRGRRGEVGSERPAA